MKLRLSQDGWILISLLILVVVFASLAGKSSYDSGSGMGLAPKRTTYSSNYSGVKALYETLHDLGYHTERQLSELTSPPEDGVLFIITPDTPISLEEWESVRKWVERGNVLIFADDDYINPDPTHKPKIRAASPTYPSFLSINVKSLSVPDDRWIDDTEWSFDKYNINAFTQLMNKQQKKWTTTSGATHLPMVPMYETKWGTSVALARCGKGKIIQICSGWPLSNQGIASGDNLTLILDALNYRDPNRKFTVTFDEFHHGYGEGEGITSLLSLPAKLGLLQLLVAFLLLIFAVSRRFGRPIPLNEGQRQRSEYLRSMTALLMRASAVDAAKTELDRKFVDDVAKMYGLPPSASVESILHKAARDSENYETLKELIASTQPRASDDASLLAITLRRNRFLESLQTRR